MAAAWMSIIEYARQYNVSDMTVRRRIKTGRLNAELREGKYYIPVSDPGHKVEDNRGDYLQNHQKNYGSKHRYEPRNEPRNDPRTEPKEPKLRAVESINVAQAVEFQLERISDNFEQAVDQIKQKEEMLKMNFSGERRLFEEKMKLIELELGGKNKEIELLKKEIEDLEFLVRILEERKN